MKWPLLIFDVGGTLIDNRDEMYPHAKAFILQAHKHGAELALASNLGRGSLQRFVARNGLAPYFSVVVSADDATFKPAPDMIELVLSLTGYDSGSALMIGDSEIDITAAKSAGVSGCMALWGVEETDRKPAIPSAYQAKSFSDLASLIGLNG